MDIIGDEKDYRAFKNPAVTLGNFDGVHLGHQKIIKRVKEVSSKMGGESIVYTFRPHPLDVLAPSNSPPLINSPREKLRIIEELGIDVLIYATFTPDFSRISPRNFVEGILIRQIGVKSVLVGQNYTFGKGKQGTIDYLMQLGDEFDFDVEVINPVKIGDDVVSSTRIRDFIKNGEVKLAKKFLGREFSLQGEVVMGKSRGKDLGFPTANLAIEKRVYPKPGIYAVRASCQDSSYLGVVNIGFNPTFGNNELSTEVHIFDFHQDIYGRKVEIFFVDRLRDERKFESPRDLVRQIERDITEARKILSEDTGRKREKT